jgi:hypothetical protein
VAAHPKAALTAQTPSAAAGALSSLSAHAEERPTAAAVLTTLSAKGEWGPEAAWMEAKKDPHTTVMCDVAVTMSVQETELDALKARKGVAAMPTS